MLIWQKDIDLKKMLAWQADFIVILRYILCKVNFCAILGDFYRLLFQAIPPICR